MVEGLDQSLDYLQTVGCPVDDCSRVKMKGEIIRNSYVSIIPYMYRISEVH